jgi:diphosphate-dependent phosphofructokinase
MRKTTVVPGSMVISKHEAVRVGIAFCGRQSPRGRNVVLGLYEPTNAHSQNIKLIGFLGGSDGLLAQRTLRIIDKLIASYKNEGGYDMLGQTKNEIRMTEQVNVAMASWQLLKLDARVIIGGVTSNTDAAQLAETFTVAKCATMVVGVLVTLNEDLKNQFVATTVGFDTMCKVNAQLVSNVCIDALSAEKYYYFIRLMRRKASHVALECALHSLPNMVVLGEDVAASKLTIFILRSRFVMQFCQGLKKTRTMGLFLFLRALWRVFMNYMLCFRKSMASMAKVFLLSIFLLNFHFGHLHSLSFCPLLSGSSCYYILSLMIQINFPQLRSKSF